MNGAHGFCIPFYSIHLKCKQMQQRGAATTTTARTTHKFMANRYVRPILKINFNTMIARIIAIIFRCMLIFLACVCHCSMLGTVYLPFISRCPAQPTSFVRSFVLTVLVVSKTDLRYFGSAQTPDAVHKFECKTEQLALARWCIVCSEKARTKSDKQKY